MPLNSNHILVVGGTGQCGQIFISQAIEAGYELTLFARNPDKFPASTRNHIQVVVVKGEFTDVDVIKNALSKGATILVSLAGPDFPFNKGLVGRNTTPFCFIANEIPHGS